MAFSNKIELQPGSEIYNSLSLIVFSNIRNTTKRKSRRLRECYCCGHPIQKGDKYINHQFKYDRRIITVSFHEKCFIR